MQHGQMPQLPGIHPVSQYIQETSKWGMPFFNKNHFLGNRG